MAFVIPSSVGVQVLLVLRSKLLDDITLPWISRIELQNLERTVSAIQAVLLDAEEQQSHSATVKIWLENLSHVMYDADDLLDEYSTEVARVAEIGQRHGVICSTFVSFFASFFIQRFFHAFKMNRDIKAIRNRLDEISQNKNMFHFEARFRTEEEAFTRRETVSAGPIAVVGRENDLEKLEGMLLNYQTGEDVSVTSVVGLPGIGKTALAQHLYNHDSIKQHFELRLWLNVSDNFDVDWIVGRLMETLTREKVNVFSHVLRALFMDRLRGRKFLLVLDDVRLPGYALQQWGSLLHMLRHGGKGSKILVTARSVEVATPAAAEIYHLRGLSLEASWSLFNRIVFHEEEPIDAEVRRLGEGIVWKCNGNPLLIKTMGNSLAFKDPKKEWLAFADESFGTTGQSFGTTGHQTDDSIYSVLRLSYQELPSHLKQCFEYCSLFPKESEIEVQTLIHLWIAQGFVHGYKTMEQPSIEGVGRTYFLELVRRFFFEEMEKDKYGKIRTFKVNNLMHGFANWMARDKHRTVGSKEGNSEYFGENVRHLSFSTHLDASVELPPSVLRAKSLRTILLANQEFRISSKVRQTRSILKGFSSSFIRLRALDAHNSGIEDVPSSIRNLTSLRYLDLSDNDAIKLLPDSLTDLWNLQVLKLSGCERLRLLPSSIGRLVNLRHLYCEDCWNLSHMPHSIGKLTSLVTLTWFVLPKDPYFASHRVAAGLNDLAGLNCLRGRLEIRNLGAYIKFIGEPELDESAAFLREKKGLQSLSLCWNSSLDEEDSVEVGQQNERVLNCLEPPRGIEELELCGYGGEELPSWLSSLENLISLQIRDCQRCRFLPPLEKFPLLKFCWFESLPVLEYIDRNGFNGKVKYGSSFLFSLPSLKELYLFKCPKLKGWWKGGVLDSRILPQFHGDLSTLEIRDCPKLDQMPLFPSLKGKLVLENVNLAPLRQTMQIQAAITGPSSSSSPVTHPLSKLKALWISSIEESQTLPEYWLQELASLQELRIDCWTTLAFLPPGIRHLTSLRELDIRRCPQLKQRCAGNKAADWPNISLIPNITIDAKMIQLGGIYQLNEKDSAALIANFSLVHPLSKVSSITIENLEYVPEEWLQTLSTLKELNIVNCPSLESRPQVMHYLTSLQKFQIG